MPIIDCYAAIRSIRRMETLIDRRIPIIAMTAYALKGEKENVMN